MTKGRSPRRFRKSGFTLVELMVSMGIMMVILLICVQTIDAVRRTWSQTTGSIAQFQEARDGFEAMTRRISQATLNTYWDYTYTTVNGVKFPESYARQSELRFISGPTENSELVGLTTGTGRPGDCIFFQAPLGFTNSSQYTRLDNLLNTWGFYVEWNSDTNLRPAFLNQVTTLPVRYRFRLMELMDPSEQLNLFQSVNGFPSGSSGLASSGSAAAATYTSSEWFTIPMGDSTKTHSIAENVICMSIVPAAVTTTGSVGLQDLSSDQNIYNTAPASTEAQASTAMANQLPPVVVVSMTAVDEVSFGRYQASRGSTEPTWPEGLFVDPAKSITDQTTLETLLKKYNITYRTFSSQIAIPGAKWSSY